jgi:type 1 glutamine amidotransferase
MKCDDVNGILFLAALVTVVPATTAQPPIHVLIVDGINNHDWAAGTRLMREILERDGRFTVDVSTTPAKDAPAAEWNTWRPNFSRYNVVINNFNGGHLDDGVRWPAEVERALEAYVRGGGGLVIFHAANNAFLHWPEYNDMIGLGWRARTFGKGISINDDGKVVTIPQGEGNGPGHPPRLDFQIHLTAYDHPITHGMPKVWMHPSEQLTHGQHGPAEGLTILTYASSPVTKQNEPMDWVRDYGKGRIYTTMLGHTWKNEPNPNFDCVGFQTLFARGVEWAATGKVTIPIPSDFPGPDAVSLRKLK